MLVCFKSSAIANPAAVVVLVCVVAVVLLLLLIYTGIKPKISATIMKAIPMKIPIYARFDNAMIDLCEERNLE
jgi:hypothetical protein